MTQANFKYTFPIAKADERDGELYVYGEATGPEVDIQNERMAPSAIEDFALQIRTAMDKGEPIPFTEIHQRDGVFKDLGEVISGWVTPDFHLGVEVHLDKENPAAVFLHKQLKKGKKMGMSIFGNVPSRDSFKDEMVEVGKSVRTFYKVNLESIGRTTMPVWYPSLGTVLAKAVDEAAEGDNTVSNDAPKANEQDTKTSGDEQELEIQPRPTDNNLPQGSPVEEDTTTATSEGVEDKEKKADEHARTLAAEAQAPTGITNEEIAAKAQPIAIDPTQLVKLQQMTMLMNEFGLLAKVEQDVPATPAPATPAPATTEKSMPADDTASHIAKAIETATADLRAQLATTQAQLQQVLENTPEGSRPALLSKSEDEAEAVEEFRKEFSQLPPAERLLLSLAARHSNKGK